MEYDLTLFEKGLEELGIALSQEQKKQFITYYEYCLLYTSGTEGFIDGGVYPVFSKNEK